MYEYDNRMILWHNLIYNDDIEHIEDDEEDNEKEKTAPVSKQYSHIVEPNYCVKG